MLEVSRIEAEPPRGFENEYYQNYYRMALRLQFPSARMQRFPSPHRWMRKGQRILGRMRRSSGIRFPAAGAEQCGRYIVHWKDVSHPAIRMIIDAHDSADAMDWPGLEWCDLYFKANLWPDREYPAKVHPVVNGNGELNESRIEHLRGLRSLEKKYDLVFVSRIWGGIEHNCRLFEALVGLPGKVKLLAVFPTYGGSYGEELNRARIRLEKAGVPCTSESLSREELWRYLAASKVVLLRAGKHLCLPWRTLDLLAMGSAILLDAKPRPQWPVPLEENKHFACAGLSRPEDTGAAPQEEYSRIAQKIDHLLASGETENLSARAGCYFDQYASPRAVGEYMATKIMAEASNG